MKVLLINPPWKHFAIYPPIGLSYVAGYLNLKNIEYDLLECEANKITNEELKRIVEKGNYDIAGLTATTSSFEAAKLCAQTIRKTGKNIKIVLGGVHASSLPKETIACDEFDVIVKGEGEITFYELIGRMRFSEDLAGLLGVCYKKENGEVVENGNRPLVQDIDTLPFPARNKLPNHKYLGAPSFPKVGNIATIVTTRGCPFPCTFCSAHAVWDKKIRMRSKQNVIDEIREVWEKYGVRVVMFKDDTFTLKKLRVYEICADIRKYFPDLLWNCSSRVDTVDYDLLKAMKESGCRLIEFGVESGSERILNTIKKEINLELAEKAIQNCKKLGIQTNVYFMIGNPGETMEDIEKTIEFAKRTDPDSAQFAITTPFPGSQLYEQFKDEIGKVEDWNAFIHSNLSRPSDIKPVFQMSNLDQNQLGLIVAKMSRYFLFKPKRLFQIFLRIRSFGELVRKAKAGIDLLKS